MGLGLCLLAAAYPEGQFVGIDFHPGHIAYSQWLAQELQISNIVFHEGDFSALAASEQQLPVGPDGHFDYVVAHGILSWIAEPVRQAMLGLTNRLLKPGGAFYCSYNTFPGWLDRTVFKALLTLERERPGADGFLGSIQRTAATLMRLSETPSDANPTRLSRAFPGLIVNVRHIQEQIDQPSYLCGEYGAEPWQPFYVAEVHRLAAAHKLDYVASATLPDNFPSFMASHLAAVVEEERDPLIQQTLLDMAINQCFRRDLFVKGAIPLTRTAYEALLAQQMFCCLRASDTNPSAQTEPVAVTTNLGSISIEPDLVGQLLSLLQQAPASLGDIHQALGRSVDDLLKLTSLLLHEGWIGLDRGPAIPSANSACRSVNQRMLELIQAGNNLNFIASPVAGHGGVGISVLDAFTLAGIQQGIEGDVLASCVWMGMASAGVDMRNREGSLIDDPDQAFSLIQEHVALFLSSSMTKLRLLGIVG
ncbi:class I SAM-dependent methyltransferase [Synechococcus sp. CBW1006]|uniref:class I SAM-dependent methyltransferase n=1 Tax=Synechococcus sp. CBW1006 TaxID=1353138 RepID=UPI0018CE5FFF|nr:class I SAM-dependent methyltransferase [Synechococcus sp. CBW1006]QPN65701.1 methyltransferase regulatory domain-containing protein [Synechococcus sp. CBW1006]